MRGRPSPARHWCSGRGRRSPLAAVTSLGSLFTTDKGSTSFLTAHYYVCFLLPSRKRAPRVLFSRRLIFAFLLIGDFLRRVFLPRPVRICMSRCSTSATVFFSRTGSHFLSVPVLFLRVRFHLYIYSFLTRLPIFTSLADLGLQKRYQTSGCRVACFFIHFNVF